jgi:transposase
VRVADRAILAALTQVLPRARKHSLLVQPATLVRWHRPFIRRRWTYLRGRPAGRHLHRRRDDLCCASRRRTLDTWGYKRIHGELVGLGISLSPSSVWNILHRDGIEPAPRRASVSWRQFLRQQAAEIIECDFFTVETLWLPPVARALLHRAGAAPRVPRRCHRQPEQRLGHPASAQPDHDPGRSGGAVALPDPRPRPFDEVFRRRGSG